jgi:Undecaprenyl-phosphate galactose phosphotransferase WbaP
MTSIRTQRGRQGSWILPGLLLVCDLLTVASAFTISYHFRKWLPLLSPLAHGADIYLDTWPVLLLWPLGFLLYNLYPGWWLTASEELRRLVWGSVFAGLLTMSVTFITRTGPQYSRPIVVGGCLLSLVLIPAIRLTLKRLFARTGLTGPPAVVLGAGETARIFMDGVRRLNPPPIVPIAVFDDDPKKVGQSLGGVSVLGPINEAPAWASEHEIHTAVVAMPGLERSALVRIVHRMSESFPNILLIPNLFGIAVVDITPRQVQGILGLELRQNLLNRYNRFFKRLIDFLTIILILPLVLFLGILISLAILIDSGTPVFFLHQRIGRGGKPFRAWKFRSMVSTADEVFQTSVEKNGRLREEWDHKQKVKQDPRLTRVGSFLRRLSLDEFPQLWNVFKGDMSLVGPRPIIQEEIAKYGEAFDLYRQVRPGLTGLWQVSGRSDLPYEDRVWLDSHYVSNWSIWLDIVILVRTIGVVFSGRGAY